MTFKNTKYKQNLMACEESIPTNFSAAERKKAKLLCRLIHADDQQPKMQQALIDVVNKRENTMYDIQPSDNLREFVATAIRNLDVSDGVPEHHVRKTYATRDHECFSKLLRVGEYNATLLSDIQTACGVKNKRRAYKIVEDLINKYGLPVGANKNGRFRGYFIISDNNELDKVVSEQTAAIESQRKKVRNLQLNFQNGIHKKA